jgi:hypothetical protein
LKEESISMLSKKWLMIKIESGKKNSSIKKVKRERLYKLKRMEL